MNLKTAQAQTGTWAWRRTARGGGKCPWPAGPGGVAALTGMVALSLAACGGDDANSASSTGDLTEVNFQLSWVGDYSDIGEMVALSKGYYEEAGIDMKYTPGGTNADPITMAVSGQAQVSKVGSSPSIMLARAQGREIKAFAASLQKHPYTYFSLAENPVKTPKDFEGKTVGVQATSGETLIAAVMEMNDVDAATVDIQVMGDNTEFLLQGQADVVAGWATNREAMKPLESAGVDYAETPIWDLGIQLYANMYIATDDYIASNPEVLQSFVEASAKGWEYAASNPDEALDILMEEFPSLTRESQEASLERFLDVMFEDTGDASFWGEMTEERWQAQLDLWDELGEFESGAPQVSDVMTREIVEDSASSLPAFNR